jgi:uncharacterized membrane protein YfcA
VEIEYLGLIALGFAVGTYGTIIGLGGGFILVPLLLLMYPDYGPESFTAISLAVVWANATSGSVAYSRQRRIDYLTGFIFVAASAPGVVAGVLLVHLVPERLFTILFAFLMMVLAGVALRGPPRRVREPLSGPGVLRRSFETPEGTYRYAYRVWQGVTLSLGVGLVSTMFGIGGGAIHVPAMIAMLHVPVRFAVATSQFILALATGGATLIHLANGTLAGDRLVQAAALGAGAIPGAQMGAWIARRMRPRATLALLAVALAFLATRLLVKGLFQV